MESVYYPGMGEWSSLPATGPVLIGPARVASRVRELGSQIASDYGGRELVMLVVLRGAFVFAADLARAIGGHVDLRVDFVRAGSYGSRRTSSGTVTLEDPAPDEIRERDVLVVEDILDTGRTAAALFERLTGLGARSVAMAALLVRTPPPPGAPPVRYRGFPIGDGFVVGCGLDYGGRYRHLSDVRLLDAAAGGPA